jgi:tRNA threonylcarbamoyladenosine biosynthesis protein TsaB
MTKILAIETSTDACSAALLNDSALHEEFQIAPQQHTKIILPMIDKLMQQAKLDLKNLDAIAFGYGPGSFTGVRLAASIAQGLGLGANLPVIKISSLRALAQQVFNKEKATKVLVAQDARMQEIYFGSYNLDANQIMQEAELDKLVSAETLPLPKEKNGWTRAGNAWEIYADNIDKEYAKMFLAKIIYPRAQEVAILAAWDFACGLAVPPEEALPNYLRNEIVKKKD